MAYHARAYDVHLEDLISFRDDTIEVTCAP